MQFTTPLICGTFLRRYKRFFADVRLDDGTTVVAHCANSGSMKTCYVPEGRVWLSEESNPKRRLKYTWQISDIDKTRVFVQPVLSNRIAREAIASGVIPELDHYDSIATEPRIDEGTRLDLLLTRGNERCYVEVKSATLSLGAGRIAFPDAVTERGTKHLRELAKLAQGGQRAVLLFSVNRTDALSVEPACAIDPVYGETLRWALLQGVEVLAYRAAISTRGVQLAARIPVVVTGAPG